MRVAAALHQGTTEKSVHVCEVKGWMGSVSLLQGKGGSEGGYGLTREWPEMPWGVTV